MRLFGLLRRNRRWERQVDAHIDGRLTPVERALLGERMDESAAVRRTLQETLALKRALRAMPEHPAPRSFAITEAMLAAAAPSPALPARGARVTMRLSQATAFVAVAAFGLVIAVDFAGNNQDDPTVAGSTDTALSEVTAEGDVAKSGDPGSGAPEMAPAPTLAAGTNADDGREAAPDLGSLQQDSDGGDASAVVLVTTGSSGERDYLPVYLALGGVLALAVGAWGLSRRQLARAVVRLP